MGSLIEELKRWEAAAWARGGPAAQPDGRARGGTGQGREHASRLAIALEEVTRVLEESASAELPEGPAKEPRPDSPAGLVTVPPREEGADASVLPRSYRDLLEVVADAGRPLKAAQVAAAAGLRTGRAKAEALRPEPKRLAGRGWPGSPAACSRS
jgi:hypothetical protein